MPRGDPVPLDVAAEFVGSWWIPGRPDDAASGRLLYHPEYGLTLELVGGAFAHADPHIDWLLGMTVDGRRISVQDCVLRHATQSLPGGLQVELRVNRAFIDIHAANAPELSLHLLDVRMANLTRWLGISGIQTTRHTLGAGGQIIYRDPGDVTFAQHQGVRITAQFEIVGSARPSAAPTEVSIEQRAWIRFRHRYRRHADQLLDLAELFNGLLAFATSAESPLLELRGEATQVHHEFGTGRPYRRRDPVWILFSRVNISDLSPYPESMTFRFSDAVIFDLLPVARWFRRAGVLEPIYNLYLSALPTRSLHIEYRFLAFAQALDAVRGRLNPASTDDYFMTKIEGLVENLPARLRSHVPAHFPTLVRDTRNYFTHWDPQREASAAQGQRLYALTRCTKILLEVTLLMALGFTKTAAAQLVEDNNRLMAGFQSFYDI